MTWDWQLNQNKDILLSKTFWCRKLLAMKNETNCVIKTLFLYFLFSKSISIRNFTLTCQKRYTYISSFILSTLLSRRKDSIFERLLFFSYNILIFYLFNTNWESTLWMLNIESSWKVYFVSVQNTFKQIISFAKKIVFLFLV